MIVVCVCGFFVRKIVVNGLWKLVFVSVDFDIRVSGRYIFEVM